MRVADAIATWLAEKEIYTAYAIIGGGNVVLFDSIQKKGATNIVCVHHEQAAAMASCYHNRISGRIASVVLCTTGAGSTNAITGVMAAFMDSIPLLVISGNDPIKYLSAHTRVKGTQAYDSSVVARPFTKLGASFSPDGDPRLALQFGYEKAVSGRQGPVWLDLAKDVANATI